jgi:conjugative transfer signal peptidase TraF
MVDQPMLVLSLALAFGFLAAAIIANSTIARTQKTRAFRVIAFAAAIVITGWAALASGLRVNFTPSMPLGVYRLVPVSKNGIRPGMIVAICAPVDAAKLGRHRGYLAAGPCPADTELLLKAVVAIAGDKVAISTRGATVNRCLLPHSRPLSLDAAGRRLLSWPQGRYRLLSNQLWLHADSDRSWDSRYWGPAAVVDVAARAFPLLTIPLASRSSSGEMRFGAPRLLAPHPHPNAKRTQRMLPEACFHGQSSPG